MFPGSDRLVVIIGEKEDGSRRRFPARPALLHDALTAELREMFGEENVALK
jgi:hypothetical protein